MDPGKSVAEIQYPHSWYNLQEKEVWVAVHFLKGNELQRDHIELPAGYYPSAKRICKGIEAKKHRTELRKKYDIGLDEVNHNMLGFKQTIFQTGNHIADFVADVNQGLNSLYVYCPLVEPRMVGDAHVPPLRIVPVEGRDGQMVTRVFDPIQYCTLLQRRFQDVEIDIRDDMGRVVPFERGRVVVTLHCRKKTTYLPRSRLIVVMRNLTKTIIYIKLEADRPYMPEVVFRKDMAWEVYLEDFSKPPCHYSRKEPKR